MRDLALQTAGALDILVAVVRGAIAELRVFAKACIQPRRCSLQASAVEWTQWASC